MNDRHAVETPIALLAAVPQATAEARTEVQNAVRDAVRDALRGARDGYQEGTATGQAAVTPAPVVAGAQASQAIIDALQAQIAAERANIGQLTAQLTSATSNAAEGAITDQIEQSQERLSALQRQLDRALGVSQTRTEVLLPPPLPESVIPREAVQITEMFFVTVAVVAVGIPLARAFGRWLDRRGAPAPRADTSLLEPRLERIEQAIDAVAIEVERISEGQRFTNKLMGELRALPAPNPLEPWPPAAVREGARVPRTGE